MSEVVDILQQLVRIPSVNPMGRHVEGPEYLERALTEHLQAWFAQHGLPFELQTVEPDRANIIARLDGDEAMVIMFEAHQDTVPVDGMKIPPFDPQVRDGRVYGRGACDIKGGMACMLATIARLARERPRGMPTVLMACTVNEEHGFSGALQMAQLCASGSSAVVPRRPDAVVVAEPTELQVVVAHKGVVRWKCHVRGRACHSSQPQLGDNAIYKMTRVVQALERYAADVAPTLAEHPLLGRPTLSVGTIAGGISVNTVPDLCTIEIDRRLLPDEDPEQAYRAIVEFVDREAGAARAEHEPPYLISRGLSDEGNAALADAVCDAIRSTGWPAEKIGVPFGTNAPAYAAQGMPTVVFGPGSIAQAHTDDEWIEIAQLEAAAEILYRLVTGDWTGRLRG